MIEEPFLMNGLTARLPPGTHRRVYTKEEYKQECLSPRYARCDDAVGRDDAMGRDRGYSFVTDGSISIGLRVDVVGLVVIGCE